MYNILEWNPSFIYSRMYDVLLFFFFKICVHKWEYDNTIIFLENLINSDNYNLNNKMLIVRMIRKYIYFIALK
ncbi:hypothetical protein STAPHY8AQ_21194 [Staphylococcus sp. 8AQ]|nr:hypothetical protein STAPHY8AQ_21194 [Staphylococcus sp. 8AQ]